MKFCVCIKQVPDVATPMQISGGELVYDPNRTVLNAYDASAVEEALVLTEKHGGEVHLLLAGPERASETIRKALAMGAASATHVLVAEGTPLDSAAVAGMLVRELEGAGFDVILTGKQSQDTDAGLAGAMLAERLGLPYTTNAVGLGVDTGAGTLVVTRQGDTGQEIHHLPTPCLVTCSNDMNDPRIPGLKGIMASKKKPVEQKQPGDVADPRVRTLRYEAVPEREPGRQLTGEPEELAAELARLLHTEARVV
jgi:electron transfer flavoprotein beta subunit